MKNKIYLLLGLLFISMGVGLVFYNFTLDKHADKKSHLVVKSLNLQTHLDKDIPEKEEPAQIPTKEVDGVEFIGILTLESLGEELPIAAKWSYDILKTYPARYKGDTYEEPLIILAHNYRSQFGKIDNLKEGDKISFTDIYDRTTDYEVEELEILDGSDVEHMVETDYDLTLFTCTLDGRQRITIRASKI